MANAIRPDFDPGCFTEIVEKLDTEYIVLGLGLQHEIPSRLSVLHPRNQRLLRTFNERATLLGVRGTRTAEWLKKAGIERAHPLGCPSLYVYPKNIFCLVPPPPDSLGPILTAGHIAHTSRRTVALLRLLAGKQAHYVMQDELFEPHLHFSRWQHFYNDATGQIHTEWADTLLSNVLGICPNFAGYWYFEEVCAWRVFCSRFTLFIGDRFHCAVVAMHAGVPSLIVQNDLRVTELTEFFGIPTLTLENMESSSLSYLVSEYLSENSLTYFKKTYQQRLREFLDTFAKLGIALSIMESYPDHPIQTVKVPTWKDTLERMENRLRGVLGPVKQNIYQKFK